MKRIVAAFDFDGTLTHKDTLLPFLKYTLGKKVFYRAILKNLCWLIAYKFKLYPNWKAKQRLFSTCFKGYSIKELENKGKEFASTHPDLLKNDAIRTLEKHLFNGDKVYIISASMELWIKPLLAAYPSVKILATLPEVSNRQITGRFASKNCYGKEKVARLMEQEPLRNDYILYAYGDSSGDKDLLLSADHSYYNTFVD